MNYKKLIPICLIFIVGIFSVIFLYYSSTRGTKLDNGFSRYFSSKIELLGTFEQEQKNLEIIGLNDSEFFIRRKDPCLVTTIKYFPAISDGNKTYRHNCVIPPNSRFILNDSLIYIFNGNEHSIVVTNREGKIKREIVLPKMFSSAIFLQYPTILLRSSDSSGLNRILKKVDLNSLKFKDENLAFPKLNDGGLTTDGQLHFDRKNNSIVYTYYYANGFFCIDTNFSQINRFRTIDTLTMFQTSVIKKGNALTHRAPPRFVSLNSSVSNGYLFVHSALKADNETQENFMKNCAIDVYNLANGRYASSFYLPKFKGKSASSFMVHENLVLALFDNAIQIYKITL